VGALKSLIIVSC